MLAENLRILSVVLGTLAVFTLIANSIPQVQSEVPPDLDFSANVTEAELVSSGEALYSGAGGCVACHGLGTRAPNLLTDEGGTGAIGARCGSRVPGQDCKSYLYASMVDPNDFLVAGYSPIMPDMRRSMSDAQIWATVAFLESQGGTVTVTGSDIVSEGDGSAGTASSSVPTTATAGPASASSDPLDILRDNTCLVCHQFNGEGTPMGPPFDGIGSRVSSDYIRSSILDPAAEVSEGYENFAGLMPATFGTQMTASQLEIVVQFLANQR